LIGPTFSKRICHRETWRHLEESQVQERETKGKDNVTSKKTPRNTLIFRVELKNDERFDLYGPVTREGERVDKEKSRRIDKSALKGVKTCEQSYFGSVLQSEAPIEEEKNTHDEDCCGGGKQEDQMRGNRGGHLKKRGQKKRLCDVCTRKREDA